MASFWDQLKSFLHISKREVLRTTVIGKTMIEESQLETKKRNLLRELGDLTFQLYKKGEIKNKKVEAFCRKINIILNRIDEKQTHIDEIKAGKTTTEGQPKP